MAAAWATATALALGLAQVPLAFAGPPDGEAPAPVPAPSMEEEPPPKTAILPLVVDGELPDADREALTNQLVEGLERGSFEIVTPDQVAAAVGDGDCSKPACMKKIAAKTGATHIVRTTLQVVDRDYTVGVELYDGTEGTKVVSSSDGCEICGVVDVGGLIETQAATLKTKLDALASGPATINITSTPEGAEVTLDGEAFGVTPVDKRIIPGDHIIRVSKEGYIAVQEKRTFVQGARESLNYELEKVPNRLPKRPYGWASLGIGIAALAGSIGTAAALHGRAEYRLFGACDESDPTKFDGEDCAYLWDTMPLSLPLGIVGGALTTLGVAILLNTSKNPRKAAKAEAAARHLKVGPSGVAIRF